MSRGSFWACVLAGAITTRRHRTGYWVGVSSLWISNSDMIKPAFRVAPQPRQRRDAMTRCIPSNPTSTSTLTLTASSTAHQETPAPTPVTGESFQLSFDLSAERLSTGLTACPQAQPFVFGADLGLCGLLPAGQLRRIQNLGGSPISTSAGTEPIY